VLGGTFDILHRGHTSLLRFATQLSKRLIIGITSDTFAQKLRAREVRPLPDRLSTLKSFCGGLNTLCQIKFVVIDDELGPLRDDPTIEAVFLSTDLYLKASKIESERAKRGLPPVMVYYMSPVLAEDGLPISSTRIARGEIDKNGRLIGGGLGA